MRKYIWPSDVAAAAKWYLEIFSGKRKLNVDSIMAEQVHSQYRELTRDQTYHRLEYLNKKGLISKTGSYRKLSYEITNEGLNLLGSINLVRIQPPSNTWDKKWRLVMFDIPEQNRSARDQIRRLLKELGFRQLQLSVWAHPLPCLNQFEDIQKAYGITEHLYLIQTDTINMPASIVSHFQRLYPKLKIK